MRTISKEQLEAGQKRLHAALYECDKQIYEFVPSEKTVQKYQKIFKEYGLDIEWNGTLRKSPIGEIISGCWVLFSDGWAVARFALWSDECGYLRMCDKKAKPIEVMDIEDVIEVLERYGFVKIEE